MNQLICQAIRQKKVITFVYNGDERIVEPFCYGRNSKDNDVLRAFQIGGISSSGKPYGWRMYIVNDMVSVSVTAKTFDGVRPDYNPNDSHMEVIYCAV